MKSFSVFLLDDDAVFLAAFKTELQNRLRARGLSFSVRAFTRCAEFLEKAVSEPPDLVISDIELPEEKQSGIDCMRTLRSGGCEADIIFLTGYLHYATDIFDLKPLYFILKSEYRQRIPEAIDIFLENMRQRQSVLSLTVGNMTELVPVNAILYCERVMRKTVVHCSDRSVSTAASLSEIAQSLPKDAFAFAHQSILINLRFVARFGKTDVFLTNGAQLPVSRSQADDFRAAMAAYLSKA